MELEDLGDIIQGLGDHLTHPDRPFTGQPYTDQGERGKTEVHGIRFRDLADCVAKAFVDASSTDQGSEEEQDEWIRRADDGTLSYNDLYRLDLSKMDPVALIQNVCCRVEEAMGIFPNIPRLECDEDGE